MREPDFAGLRADLEAATRLPEFATVVRRARRVRGRDRAGRLSVTLIAVAALAPAGLVGLNATPGGGGGQTQDRVLPIGPDQPQREPTPSTPIVSLYAIAGQRLDALYAAVDVCVPTTGTAACSLQVVPLAVTAQQQRPPIAVGELRETPTDSLGNVQLQLISPQSLLLSAMRPDGRRAYRQIRLAGGGNALAPEPSAGDNPRPGDRLLQLRRHGELYYVRQLDDQVIALKSPPDLRGVTAITGAPPGHGWWVVGTDPRSGELSVAVSHDLGGTWVVRSLRTVGALGDPVLVTVDANLAFAFVQTATGIEQRRTLDGGQTWQILYSELQWPSSLSAGATVSRRLGAVVRLDGSLVLWLEEPPGAVFLESTDLGVTFRPTVGPAGPILAVGDGYVTLTDPPSVSRDARTWTSLPRPATTQPD